MFTSILNKRVNDWVENNNIVSFRFGFGKGRSTVDALFVLNAVIQTILNERKKLILCIYRPKEGL